MGLNFLANNLTFEFLKFVCNFHPLFSQLHQTSLSPPFYLHTTSLPFFKNVWWSLKGLVWNCILRSWGVKVSGSFPI